MSPTSYQLLHPATICNCRLDLGNPFMRIGTGDRGRTGTGITTHGILSPGRLPIPPRRHLLINLKPLRTSDFAMAPRVGLEPTTYRLTAGCSAIELPRNIRFCPVRQAVLYSISPRDVNLYFKISFFISNQ